MPETTGNRATLGENILTRFAPGAARFLHEAIESAGGNEVFFAGALDAQGRVFEARVLARGHRSAVLAVIESLALREVVIHNHPSGDLTPSEADLSLASAFSANGHGVYIVDNDATRVYVVVEPFLAKDVQPLDAGAISNSFAPNSRLAANLAHFEVRPQQKRLMESVAMAFNRNGISVVEAPTGVGKTLAYLLPAVLWATRNKERVVVSTRTINLQEQIMFKDIPLLQRVLDEKFSACLVKGRGNYLCRRKLERALSEASLFDDESDQAQLESIAEWAEESADGSLADLAFVPKREIWERVCSEADSCGGNRCPDQKKCFIGRARREMARADLLVVNHHMFFSDVALKQQTGDFTGAAVLPAYKRVIFDEAHSIEDSATEYFGVTASRLGTTQLLSRFQKVERGRDRGLMPLLKGKLIRECVQISVADYETMEKLIDEQFLPALETARHELAAYFDALRDLCAEKCGQIGRDIKWRLTQAALADPTVRDFHLDYAMPAVEALRSLLRHGMALMTKLKAVPRGLDGEEPAIIGEMQELGAYLSRAEHVANVISEVTSEDLQENTVRWADIDARNAAYVRVSRCPLHVGAPMADAVYGQLNTVVMTSATLSVQQQFRYLFDRLGLDKVPAGRVEAMTLDSPFDFTKQAALLVATDLPAPDERSFQEASIEAMRACLRITRGHAFILFTSFSALDQAHRALADELRAAGITPLKQGQESRTVLLDRFRSDTASVLFATDSFWEGVDVAGEALQLVILPKLPFRVPTEPILEARAEAIEEAGGNAFRDYSVPQAVIKFRQGFGRLIRRRSDRGAVVVLDKRIITKFYGKIFLDSLPPLRMVKGPKQGVLLALERFFHGEPDAE